MINYRANMPNHCRIFIAFLVGSLFSLSLHAQNAKTFTGNLSGMKMEAFASWIESQSDYRFYFKASETDSLEFDFSVTGQTLPAILSRALEHTTFHFAIDADDHVFITEKFTIQPNLPDDYFGNAGWFRQLRESAFSVDNYLENQRNQAVLPGKHKIFCHWSQKSFLWRGIRHPGRLYPGPKNR